MSYRTDGLFEGVVVLPSSSLSLEGAAVLLPPLFLPSLPSLSPPRLFWPCSSMPNLLPTNFLWTPILPTHTVLLLITILLFLTTVVILFLLFTAVLFILIRVLFFFFLILPFIIILPPIFHLLAIITLLLRALAFSAGICLAYYLSRGKPSIRPCAASLG
ncbi:hypothetical protein BD779DRAFT_1680649 [Infundibulicybe gibba]|nr:hypothetical protein BD779DRAFT_1680649 [Infundibulicybe gibba]